MGKVMIVDDAAADLKLIESMLRASGHEVLAYADGEQAEEALRRERPDLLLLDVVMPRRNGYEILRRVKRDERTRHVPVVLVTCRNQESDRLWGRRQGADGYVTKPFTRADLLAAVGRFLAGRGADP